MTTRDSFMTIIVSKRSIPRKLSKAGPLHTLYRTIKKKHLADMKLALITVKHMTE